jgi:hypothetical protein
VNLHKKIFDILDKAFVFVEDVSRILALAFQGKKNVIIFGPGGHAKSEMVTEALRGLGWENDSFTQFFGEGMDEARLFGGLNFRKLEEDKILEYYPERSFLNHRIAVFEELFDAPASVLLALKDTLTAGELRNGAQRFKMKTEVVIVLTNREPNEISELGAAAHALTERFPLQLSLRWKNYSAGSYLAMFEKVSSRLGGPVMNGFKAILAQVVARATEGGNFVSPRTAMHAYQVCQAAAALRGGTSVSQEDLTDLRFVAGLEELGETMEADLKAAMEKAEAEKAFAQAEADFVRLDAELAAADTPIRALQVAKKLVAFGDAVASLKATDELTAKRNNMRSAVSGAISVAQARAMEFTRV